MRLVRTAALLAALVAAAPAHAQRLRAESPEPQADSVRIYDMPFELASGKIFVNARVNGRGPYPFALDTGAPSSCIDTQLCKDLGIPVQEGGMVGGAGEGGTPMGRAERIQLEFGGARTPRGPMMTVAINKRLAPYNGRPVMGLIGNDFVSARVVEVDYPRQRLTIREQPGWTYDGDGVVIPTRTRGYTFINGAVTVGDERLRCRFMIDTGAGLSMSLTTPFVNRHDLLDKADPRFSAMVGFGLGGEVHHPVCRLDSLELGDLTVDQPVCTLSQDRAGALATSAFDGLIGGDILSRYKVIFDGPGHHMILEPGPNADEPTEFDMSGLALKGVGTRPLTVFRIVEGSPADRAGIREGDTLIALDGRPVTGLDRDRVKQAFKSDGAQRTLNLRRGDEELRVRLKLRRMVMLDSPSAPSLRAACASA